MEDRTRELERLTQLPAPETDDFRLMFRFVLEMLRLSPDEAERWTTVIANRATETGHDRALCVAYIRLAEIALGRADYTTARERAERLLVCTRRAGLLQYECSYHFLLGRIAECTGQYSDASRCYEQCVAVGLEAKHPEAVHRGLVQLGNVKLLSGNPDKALEFYQRAQQVDDPGADEAERLTDIVNIGMAYLGIDEWEEAAGQFYRALAGVDRVGRDGPGIYPWAFANLGLSEIALHRDSPERAIGLLEQVRAAIAGQPVAMDEVLIETCQLLGQARLKTGDYASAERDFAVGLELAKLHVDQYHVALLNQLIAVLELNRGQLEAGLHHAEAATAIAEAMEGRTVLCRALYTKGRLMAALRNSAGARECFERAVAVLEQTADSYDRAMARFSYGRFLLEAGERQWAMEQLAAAAQIFRRLGVVQEADEASRLLVACERPAEAGAALVRAVGGVVGMALPPASALSRVLRLICEGLGYRTGAIVLGRRILAAYGGPDGAAVRRPIEGGDFCSNETETRIALYGSDRTRGQLYLGQRTSAEPVHLRLLLESLVALLAPIVIAGAELVEREPARPDELVGLRYRGVVGPNGKMRDILRQVLRLAQVGVPVLVRGESGTGKELVARALHDSGPRSGGPFVAINCAAVPADLLEAELFGVERGVATGVQARPGKLEGAAGGTLLLDEIGDMSPRLQAKLLRVLQDKQFERVGGRRLIAVDFRLVTATNQDIEAAIARGDFRADLYYRIAGAELVLPPLRERRDDIPALVDSFVAAAAREYDRNVTGIAPEALARLMEYDWPGNVRELSHVIERAVVLASGNVLQSTDLPVLVDSACPQPEKDGGTLRELRRRRSQKSEAEERERLLQCLRSAKGSIKEAIKQSGCSRAQFYRLLAKYGIRPSDWRKLPDAG